MNLKNTPNPPNGNSADRRRQKRSQERLPFSVKEDEPPQAAHEQDKSGDLNRKQSEDHQMTNPWWKRVFGPGSAAVWTAIFTGVLTVFTYLEYGVSNSTSEIQRNTERAFLNFAGPSIGPQILTNGVPFWTEQEIELNWTNTGETPARLVLIRSGANAFSPTIPDEFDYPLAVSARAAIGAKVTYGINSIVPREMLSDAWHGKKGIYLWGAATYRDVFQGSPTRLTEFCVELTHLTVAQNSPPQAAPPPSSSGKETNPPTTLQPTPPQPMDIDNPQAVLAGFQWQQCPAHNCYDHDCSDYSDRVKEAIKQ